MGVQPTMAAFGGPVGLGPVCPDYRSSTVGAELDFVRLVIDLVILFI